MDQMDKIASTMMIFRFDVRRACDAENGLDGNGRALWTTFDAHEIYLRLLCPLRPLWFVYNTGRFALYEVYVYVKGKRVRESRDMQQEVWNLKWPMDVMDATHAA